MKFQSIAINDTFICDSYPEAIFIKTRKRGATCCTPAQNAKMIFIAGRVPIEKPVYLSDDLDVTQVKVDLSNETNILDVLSKLIDNQQDKDVALLDVINITLPINESNEYSHLKPLQVAEDGGLKDTNGNLVEVKNKQIFPRKPLTGGGTF